MRYDAVNAMLLNGFLLFLIVSRSCAIRDCATKKIPVPKNFCNAGKNFPKETVKGKTKKGNPTMDNGDTITTVIAFLLVLPWLARMVVSSKAIWRALMEGHNKKRKQTI